MDCLQKLQEEPTSENIVQALKDDKLMRLADICAFVNLLAQLPGNYVMTVNGRWGSGKTFFVKEAQMIIEGTYGDDSDIRSALESNNVDAQSKNLATVYYDAWLHDGDEDPLASILDSLLRDERIQKDFFSPDKKGLKQAVQECLKAIVALLQPSAYNVVSSLSKAFDALREGSGKVEAGNGRREDINRLLPQLFEEILKATGKQRLIFFIDELDRCRPDYAVRLLETMKHYFVCGDVSFVLSVNVEQLSHTIRKHYGNDFDADLYLNRFFDYSFELPEIDSECYPAMLLGYQNIKSRYMGYMFNEIVAYYHMGARELLSYWQSVGKYLVRYSESYQEPEGIMFGALVIILAGMAVSNRAAYRAFLAGRDCKECIDIVMSQTSSGLRLDVWFGALLPSGGTFESRRVEKDIPLVDFTERFSDFHAYAFGFEHLSEERRKNLQSQYGYMSDFGKTMRKKLKVL